MTHAARRAFAPALAAFLLAFAPHRAAAAGAHPLMGVAEAAPAGATAPTGLTGFAPAAIDPELAREARIAGAIKPDSLRRHLRILTEEPHVAGTPADRATAEYVRQRLAAYGWDARIEAVPVWLNYPKVSRLELLEPAAETLAVREKGVAHDKDAHDAGVFDAFNGYSASGEATGQVVYANYGDVDDFAKLRALGIDLSGRIALVRYGKIFRGLKVRNAEEAGLAAVILYSDPADDGYAVADPYPRGQGRPADGLQRGSVQYLSEGPGDPTTPGWASTANGRRLAGGKAVGIPRIPSLPIAYGEARKILVALDGPEAPRGWQGGLPFRYHVGPGGAKVHLKSEQDYAVRPIWNVIATLKGREHPEQQVILGNHRDAWTYGALDPNSGTICMLEMGRTIGALAKDGWRPRRTLVLCSWDGEEYGLLGSTEFGEARADELSRNAVAYLNVDTAVSGHDFRAGGCHSLRDLVAEALRDVRDPGRNRPLWNVAVDDAWGSERAQWAADNRERRLRGEPERPFEWDLGALGSGSDYTVFVDHLGVPSLNLGFGGVGGNYHAMYDDFDFMDRIVDPGFFYHVAATDLWARLGLRLAEADVLPIRYSNEARFATDDLRSLEDQAADAGAGRPDSLKFAASTEPLHRALLRWQMAATRLEHAADDAVAHGSPPAADADRINAALMRAERALLGPGLPGRTWFRHELYAPGLNTGYAAVPLPRLGQALLDKSPRDWAAGIEPTAAAIERSAQELIEGGGY